MARPPRAQSNLVLGVFLLIIGALLLLLNLGIRVPWELWTYYPVPLIALGLWGLIHPTRHLDRSGGIWLLAAGSYCLIGTFELFGLGWGSAWPIFLIASGLSMILRRRERNAENPRVTHET